MIGAFLAWLRASRFAAALAAIGAALAWLKLRDLRTRKEAIVKRDAEAEKAARQRAEAIRGRIEEVKDATNRRAGRPDRVRDDLEFLRRHGRVRDNKPGNP